jgi:hypothetical protein
MTQASEPMADLREYMAHTMLRRELGLLPRLVRNVMPGDVDRAEIIGTHAEHVCFVLHLHHEGDDRLLWPRLLERAGDKATAIVPTMEEQHSVAPPRPRPAAPAGGRGPGVSSSGTGSAAEIDLVGCGLLPESFELTGDGARP